MTKDDAKELAVNIAQLLEEKKSLDVQVLDISHLTTICDFFVIASGRTELQVKAMCDALEKDVSLKENRVWHKEGYRIGKWIVLDYKDVVVHLFHKDERAFYSLERLWADGLRLSINSLG